MHAVTRSTARCRRAPAPSVALRHDHRRESRGALARRLHDAGREVVGDPTPTTTSSIREPGCIGAREGGHPGGRGFMLGELGDVTGDVVA